jgi:hypothetical protein
VDYHWQNTNAQSLIGVFNRSKTIVTKNGSLLYPPWRFNMHVGSDNEKQPISSEPVQMLDNGDRPMVKTILTQGGIQYEMLAFGAMMNDRPVDMMRVRCLNVSPEWRKANTEMTVDGGAQISASGQKLISGDALIAIVDHPREGTSEAVVTQNNWGNVSGWDPQQGWASPGASVNPAFRNITTGYAGKPIIYAFHVQPGVRYQVVAGFCEGWWSQPGKRTLDLSVDGHPVRTIDPVAEVGQNVPLLVETYAQAPGDGWLRVQVQANPHSSDQNAILNAIWIFPGDALLDTKSLIAGTPNTAPLFFAACGSADDHRLSVGSIRMKADMAPGSHVTFWLRFPHDTAASDAGRVSQGDGDKWLEATRRWWDHFYTSGANIQVPDPDVNDFYRASLAYTFLMRDKVGHFYVVKPGATVYNAFWYRDGAYITHAHDIAGYPAEAERDLRVFIQSPLPPAVNAMGTSPIEQHPDGSWDAPATEWDGQGQALWAIISHYELTGDHRWLQKAYPAIRKGAQWIQKVRAGTMRPEDAGTSHYGIFPQGFGEAIDDGNIYCYYHDFWGVLGIRKAAEAADALGQAEDTHWMSQQADNFQKCLQADVILASMKSPDGLDYIPGAPGRQAEPDKPGANIWGDIAAIYPCQAMDPRDPLIVSTFERMWDRRLQDEYQFLTHRKIWTYITADWIQALWLQGHRHRALELFWGYLNHAYTTKGWIEEMYPDTMIGTGDQPHGWAAANFVLLLRNMLVREDGDHLDLMYGIPGGWLRMTPGIKVDNAPTALGGKISFSEKWDSNTGAIDVEITKSPSKASFIRIYFPDTEELKMINASFKPIAIGGDYIDVPSKSGRYEIAANPLK